jgi:hypothetical protein
MPKHLEMTIAKILELGMGFVSLGGEEYSEDSWIPSMISFFLSWTVTGGY